LGKAADNCRKPVIVPNFLYPKNEGTVTNVDAVRAVLDALTEFTNRTVTIAGSSFSLADVFSDYHYRQLEGSYGVKFVDLHRGSYRKLEGRGKDFLFSKTLLESDCCISIGMPQMHKTLLANLSLSNFVLSGMDFDERKTVMKEPRTAQGAISAIAEKVKPAFSVIDGFSGLEGDFPHSTNFVSANAAVAGSNSAAVDSIAAKIMGIPQTKLAYLRKSRPLGIKTVGESLSSFRKKFALPRNSKALLRL
jgi:uncharacterized protein (DUF362 family)